MPSWVCMSERGANRIHLAVPALSARWDATGWLDVFEWPICHLKLWEPWPTRRHGLKDVPPEAEDALNSDLDELDAMLGEGTPQLHHE